MVGEKFKMSQEKTRQPKKSLAETLKIQFEAPNKPLDEQNYDNVLVLGKPGTMKSGSVLSHLLDDIGDDEKIFVLDVDGSSFKLIKLFHRDKYENNNIIYYDPYVTKAEAKTKHNVIDYENVIENVKGAAGAIEMMLEEGQKIKAVIFDGLSRLLLFAELKMREDKNLTDPSEGFDQRIYKIRQRLFNDAVTMFVRAKLPVYFVGHDDFLQDEDTGKLASVKANLHGDVDSILVYTQTPDRSNPNLVNFNAQILKDRGNVLNVEKKVTFAVGNNSEDVLDYNPNKAFDLIEEVQKDVVKKTKRTKKSKPQQNSGDEG